MLSLIAYKYDYGNIRLIYLRNDKFIPTSARYFSKEADGRMKLLFLFLSTNWVHFPMRMDNNTWEAAGSLSFLLRISHLNSTVAIRSSSRNNEWNFRRILHRIFKGNRNFWEKQKIVANEEEKKIGWKRRKSDFCAKEEKVVFFDSRSNNQQQPKSVFLVAVLYYLHLLAHQLTWNTLTWNLFRQKCVIFIITSHCSHN